MRRLAIVKRGAGGNFSYGRTSDRASIRTRVASFRRAVLYEVRSWRRCSLSIGLQGRPGTRSRRERGVRRCGSLSLLSAFHR